MNSPATRGDAKPFRVLLVAPAFEGRSFWNFTAACEIYGAKFPAAPLGLITVAALLPTHWNCRLVNRNTEQLEEADLDWADLVMTGGMLPQRLDTIEILKLAKIHGKTSVVGGPDATSSSEAYEIADFQVLGEAEGIIDEFIAAWQSGAREGRFQAQKFTADVTKTPIPRFDLLKRGQYGYYGVQFSRGCPFTCEFCDIIELYGRAPRVKSSEQMLAELDVLYAMGYRGHLDFVDDNFVGNKKAVKKFLPHLIEWQKQHQYPFELSTEASVNLADDDQLLAMMHEANFFAVFLGIESPDTSTLISTQKKQNTRRVLAESVHKIYRAGIFVTAGFIIGFDSEKGNVSDDMLTCINDTTIPVCAVGLLYALANTQLTRRLEREGRLFSPGYIEGLVGQEGGSGDQCTAGLNFRTMRPRREILADYQRVMRTAYQPAKYFDRLCRMVRMLGSPPKQSERNYKRDLVHLNSAILHDGLAGTERISLLPKGIVGLYKT